MMKRGYKFGVLSWMLVAWAVSAMGQANAVAGNSDAHGFDAVSIHVNKTGNDVVLLTPTEDGYELRNVSLQRIISVAYNVREDQVSGLPSWAGSIRYDMIAKDTDHGIANKPLTMPQRQQYLSRVLAERFHLASHIDTKLEPVFKLTLVPGTQKLKHSTLTESDVNAGSKKLLEAQGDILLTERFMRGNGVPISLLAKNLQFLLKRDVLDETGCTGLYDISLQWIPLDAPNPSPDDPNVRSALFTALREQLGLRLVSSKGPVQVLVVDHVETPSAN